MNASLDLPHNDFLTELNRIERLIDFISTLREFGSVDLPTSIDAEQEFINFSLQIHEKEKELSTDIPILSGTILLYIVGRFENFVRSSFETLCDAIAAKCNEFSDLPERMRKELISHTAEVIANPSRYGYDEIQVQMFIQNLSSNIQDTDGIGQINSACLSITSQNMRPGTLAELYKRVGINSLWAEIGKQSKLKVFFENNTDSQVERATRAELEEIMNIRNQIAHPSSIPTFPDADQIKKYISFLVLLSEVLTDICRVHLVSTPPNISS